MAAHIISGSVTDTHTLAEVVRAHVAAREKGVRFVLGARLRPADLPGCSVLVYPTGMDSYRLLTVGKRRAPKGECHLALEDLSRHAAGLLGIVAAEGEPGEGFEGDLRRLRELFDDDRLSLAACVAYGGAGGTTPIAWRAARSCRPARACPWWRRTRRTTTMGACAISGGPFVEHLENELSEEVRRKGTGSRAQVSA